MPTCSFGDNCSFENVADKKILLIGCGKMGEAMLAGWCASDVEPAAALSGDNFIVVEPSSERATFLKDAYGVATINDISEVNGHFDVVIFAVKPQQLNEVFNALKSNANMDIKDSLFVTIAAGVSTLQFEQALGDSARVVRALPNMPLQVGMGASAVCGGANSKDFDLAFVNALFAALGTSSVVDEKDIDAVCAISGGGPAYVAYMIEALRDAGEVFGLDRNLAESLALETIGGTYAAMKANSISPEDMRASVCSPGGTTLAAIGALDKGAFKPMFNDAIGSAVNRAAELREESGK